MQDFWLRSWMIASTTSCLFTGYVLAADVTTGNSSDGGDAASNQTMTYTTTTASGSPGGNWTPFLTQIDDGASTVNGMIVQNASTTAGYIDILDGSQVQAISIWNSKTAQDQSGSNTTITISGGTSISVPLGWRSLDTDDLEADDASYGFTQNVFESWVPTKAFYINIENGTVAASASGGAIDIADSAVDTLTSAQLNSFIHVGDNATVTGSIDGCDGIDILEAGAEVDDGDTANVSTAITGDVDLGAGNNAMMIESIVDGGTGSALMQLDGTVTTAGGNDLIEVGAETFTDQDATTNITGLIDLGGGNNTVTIAAMIGDGSGSAIVNLDAGVTLGGGDDHLYIATEYDEDTTSGTANINVSDDINLGNGANTVLLIGEGAEDAVGDTAKIFLNDSGTKKSIIGGSGVDTFYIDEANLSGHVDLTGGGADVINIVDSSVLGTVSTGADTTTVNVAGDSEIADLTLGGNMEVAKLTSSAAYVAANADYAADATGATLEVTGDVTGSGNLAINQGVSFAADTLGSNVNVWVYKNANLAVEDTSSMGSLNGAGNVAYGQTSGAETLTITGGTFSGALAGLSSGGLTIDGGTFTMTGALSIDQSADITVAAASELATNTTAIGAASVVLQDGSTLSTAGGNYASQNVTLDTTDGSYTFDLTSGHNMTLTGLVVDGDMTFTQTGEGILSLVDIAEEGNGTDTLDLADGTTFRLLTSTSNTDDITTYFDDDAITNNSSGGATIILEEPDYEDDIAAGITIIYAGEALEASLGGTYDDSTKTITASTDQDLTNGSIATTEGGTVDLTQVTTTLTGGNTTLDGGGSVNIGNTALTADTTLTLDNGTTATISGAIDNTGGTGTEKITLGGSGTLAITGSAIVPGNVEVGSNATLALDHDAIGGDLTLGDGATLAALDDVSIDEPVQISSGGAANIAGSGTISTTQLAVADTVGAATANTLNIASGSGLSAASLAATNNAGTTLTVAGGGTLTLGSTNVQLPAADSSSFTGTLAMTGGNLVLNSNLGGNVEVSGANTVVSGAGSVGGDFEVTGGARHNPGNSIATLNVAGDYTLGNGSTIEIEVDNNGNSDKVVATGNVTLEAGSTVTVTGEDGARITNNLQDMPVFTWGNTLTVAGTAAAADNQSAINTALAALKDQSAVLDYTLHVDFDDSEVLLDVQRAATYAEFGGSTNAQGVGNVLDNYAGSSTAVTQMLTQLDGMDSATLAETLNQLSPESVLGAVDAAMNTNNAFVGQQAGRTGSFRQLVWSGEAFPVGPAAEPEEKTASKGINIWVNPYATWGDQDRRKGFMGYEWDTYGVAFGIETEYRPDFLAGLSFGYAGTDVDADQYSSSEVDAYSFGAYATWLRGPLYIDAGVTYGYNEIDNQRSITALNAVAKGSTNADVFSLYAEAGYQYDIDNKLSVCPFAGAAYTYYDQDAYSESGAGGANLSYDSLDEDSFVTSLGIEGTYAMRDDLDLRASATWLHEFCDNQVVSKAAFAGSTPFETKGLEPDDDSAVLGIGLDGQIADNMTLSVDFNYELKDEYDAQNLALELKIKF